MSNHIADANKMVSDTPRTDEAYFKNSATMYDLAGEMKQIERELNVANEKIEVLLIADCERLRIEEELNAANQIIRQQQLLEEENLRLTAKVAQLYEGAKEQKQRIKRLEEVAEDLVEQNDIYIRRQEWIKAKEAKL